MSSSKPEKTSKPSNVCDVLVVTEAALRNMIKVTISIPWDNEEPLELPKALISLSRANRGLDTKQWIVRRQLKPESAPKRMILTLMIDNSSAESQKPRETTPLSVRCCKGQTLWRRY